MAEFNLADTTAILARTPATLQALIGGLPDVWVRSNEGENTWSVFDVVGHLNVGERTDWMPRTRIILEQAGLEQGETRPFDPFDRFAQFEESGGKTMEHLLKEFTRLRNDNLAALEALHLSDKQLALRGRHQRLGVVTLSQLLAAWVVHDLTHLHQISRVMADQYRDAVGPWTAFLGVLKCSGHSEP